MSQPVGEPVLYALYAVLVHRGASGRAGHYFCFTKVSISFISCRAESVLVKRNLSQHVTDNHCFEGERARYMSPLTSLGVSFVC